MGMRRGSDIILIAHASYHVQACLLPRSPAPKSSILIGPLPLAPGRLWPIGRPRPRRLPCFAIATTSSSPESCHLLAFFYSPQPRGISSPPCLETIVCRPRDLHAFQMPYSLRSCYSTQSLSGILYVPITYLQDDAEAFYMQQVRLSSPDPTPFTTWHPP